MKQVTQKKRRKGTQTAVVVVGVLLMLAGVLWVPVRHITAFSYRRGDTSTGYHQYSVEIVDGVAWAVESFDPSLGPREPWERRRELSETELRSFERLIFFWLRVPSWPVSSRHYPSSTEGQDFWSIFIQSKSGTVYTRFGYYTGIYPKALDRIANALAVPEAG